MDKPFKTKLKVGKDLPGTSAADLLKAQTMKSSSDSRRSMPGSSSSTPPKVVAKKKKKGRESGTSSEEERWLDAIKSGKLEEVIFIHLLLPLVTIGRGLGGLGQ